MPLSISRNSSVDVAPTKAPHNRRSPAVWRAGAQFIDDVLDPGSPHDWRPGPPEVWRAGLQSAGVTAVEFCTSILLVMFHLV